MSDTLTSHHPGIHSDRRSRRMVAHPVLRKPRDEFLTHYFRRIDPEVAASFTKAQRAAIRAMFGHRGATRHPVDIRWTFPVGRRRAYLVVLMGRDRRALARRQGSRSVAGRLLAQFAFAVGLLLVLFAAAAILRA